MVCLLAFLSPRLASESRWRTIGNASGTYIVQVGRAVWVSQDVGVGFETSDAYITIPNYSSCKPCYNPDLQPVDPQAQLMTCLTPSYSQAIVL